MKLKVKISIDEIDGKRYKIRLVEPVSANHKKAVITHYLHIFNPCLYLYKGYRG